MSKVTLQELGLGADDLAAIGKLSEKGMTPDQIADAIEKVSMINSTPGEIDAAVPLVKNKADLTQGKNLFNDLDPDYLADYFINAVNGNPTSTVNFNATGYIKVHSGTTYAFTKMSYLAWYTSSKTFISGLVSGQPINYATAPANAVYLRASIPKSALVAYQIEEGMISTSYEKYTGYYNKPSNLISLKDTSFYKKSRNLINKEDMFINTYIDNTNGGLASNALFHATNYIEIKPNTSYILSGVHTVGFSAWYDSDYKFISGVVNLRIATVSPINAKYIRTTSYSTHIDTAQLEEGIISSAFVSYTYIPAGIIEQNNMYQLKKWSLLGDSITAQDTWQKTVATKFGLYYQNYAIGGTKISGTTNQSFVHDDRVNAIDINSDFISVLGGINDFGLNVPIGTDDSIDINTFKGALNVLIKKLSIRFPAKRIIFTTTPYGELTDYSTRGWTNPYTNTNGNTPIDFAEAIRVICKKNSIPYVDLQLLSGWNTNNLSTYTVDSIHPSVSGQNRIANAYVKAFNNIGM